MTRKPLAPKTVRTLPGDSWTSGVSGGGRLFGSWGSVVECRLAVVVDEYFLPQVRLCRLPNALPLPVPQYQCRLDIAQFTALAASATRSLPW